MVLEKTTTIDGRVATLQMKLGDYKYYKVKANSFTGDVKMYVVDNNDNVIGKIVTEVDYALCRVEDMKVIKL